MANIRPFQAVRPNKQYVHKVAALPYDVYNRQEAYEEVQKEKLSFLSIDRAEVQFEDSVDPYAEVVYEKARDTLNQMIEDRILIEDELPCYYIYSLTMMGREQSGLVATASIDDYLNNVIKKHENTREDKEIDRIKHVDITNAHTGPIFLAYPSENKINVIVESVKNQSPLYDFTSSDGIRHAVWKISDPEKVQEIRKHFSKINQIYIADGHHRTASAVKVGLKRREENPNHKGSEEYNYFLSVLFPHDQLRILPYNRVVMDLNGMEENDFLDKVRTNFDVEKLGKESYAPGHKGIFGMYLNDFWYKLSAKPNIIPQNPVGSLDVSILQDYVLDPLLGIKDPKRDKRIDFVGGIRGLGELERRVAKDMKVAFSMYPTSIEELFNVSDAGLLMPPKSTWFEPKLRSGIFIHKLS